MHHTDHRILWMVRYTKLKITFCNSISIIMESTNQDDDSTHESKDNALNESSANVDFKCEDDEQRTTTLGGPVVEQLKTIAETGIVDIDWLTLQQALKSRLDEVLEIYLERNPDCKEEQYQEPNVGKFNLENSKDEILELIASFNEAPFTIQRICELLYSPLNYYDKTSTFLRGLEKNLRVISSHDWPKSLGDPVASDAVENNCGTSTETTQASSEHQPTQQHEDMNQGEDEQPILAQPQGPSEIQVEPSPLSSSSLALPSSQPAIDSPLQEGT